MRLPTADIEMEADEFAQPLETIETYHQIVEHIYEDNMDISRTNSVWDNMFLSAAIVLMLFLKHSSTVKYLFVWAC